MAIVGKKDTVQVVVSALTWSASMRILSGTVTQTYNKDTKEYSPARSLVPLYILPEVSVSDPDGKMSGIASLTGVEWYEGAPKGDGSNRITDGTYYKIGDGTVEGFPKYALKVIKDVPCDSPLEIYATAIFTDVRTDRTVRVAVAVQLSSVLYDNQNYSVSIDKPSSYAVDPLRLTDPASDEWTEVITAQLYSGIEPVDDSHAAYWWEVLDGGTWRRITMDDIGLSCHDDNGAFMRSLSVNVRLRTSGSYRVRAAYFMAQRPESPESEETHRTVTVKMELPHTLDVKVVQTKGMAMDIDLHTTVAYRAEIFDNSASFSDSRFDGLFSVTWKGQSVKTGEKAVALGQGRSIEFAPAAYFPSGYTFEVWPEVSLFDGDALVTDSSGNVCTVTSGGAEAVVVVPTYV